MKKSEIRQIIKEELLKEDKPIIKGIRMKGVAPVYNRTDGKGKGVIMRNGSVVAEYKYKPKNPFYLKIKSANQDALLDIILDVFNEWGK